MEIIEARSSELSPGDLADIRSLLESAFGPPFSEQDWSHALGGWHLIARNDDLIGHVAVVERTLEVDGRALHAGYVEALATRPSNQRQGVGRALMTGVADLLAREFEIGALSTGEHRFYERLGWERWRGPSYVRDGDRVHRTADEDDGIMVLRFGISADIGVNSKILCEARQGDDW